LPCLASGLFIGGDQPTIEQLVSACHQISARLDRSRFKVTVDGFYQNPKVARALTDTSLYAVWLDNGKRRCEFTRTTIGESQRNSLSWEFVYPDEGYIRVLRDPSSGSFKEATARLSAVSELEKKQAFNLSFSVLTEGWIRDNVDISLSEILQQSALSISRSDTGGGVLFALKATSRWGDLTTWHDPNVGFAPIRIVQTKKRGNCLASRWWRSGVFVANRRS
jgi:hypothetical protein